MPFLAFFGVKPVALQMVLTLPEQRLHYSPRLLPIPPTYELHGSSFGRPVAGARAAAGMAAGAAAEAAAALGAMVAAAAAAVTAAAAAVAIAAPRLGLAMERAPMAPPCRGIAAALGPTFEAVSLEAAAPPLSSGAGTGRGWAATGRLGTRSSPTGTTWMAAHSAQSGSLREVHTHRRSTEGASEGGSGGGGGGGGGSGRGSGGGGGY